MQDFKSWMMQLINTHRTEKNDNNCLILMMWFCWAIYSHRNDVKFNHVEPHPSKIVDIWNTQISKLQFLAHASEDLHIPRHVTPPHRTHVHCYGHMSPHDVFIAGQRFKINNKNIFAAFNFRNNSPHLLFYYCEMGNNRILEIFAKGFRSFLERCSTLQYFQMNIICQANFNIHGKDALLRVIKEDIMQILKDKENSWSFSQDRHKLKLKELWPWIDSYIRGICCFM